MIVSHMRRCAHNSELHVVICVGVHMTPGTVRERAMDSRVQLLESSNWPAVILEICRVQ